MYMNLTMNADEGFTEDIRSCRKREELALQLLASLPRARLANIQRWMAPLLQFDLVGSLPTETALQILAHLPYQTLLTCSLVSHRWNTLANDQSLWKRLCFDRGWAHRPAPIEPPRVEHWQRSGCAPDDEGMGDSDEDQGADEEEEVTGDDIEMLLTEHQNEDLSPERKRILQELEEAKAQITRMYAEIDSGFASISAGSSSSSFFANPPRSQSRSSIYSTTSTESQSPDQQRYSAPPQPAAVHTTPTPDYKVLYLTHTKLHLRFLNNSYHLRTLQTSGSPSSNAHNSTIYCLQLYIHPKTGYQTLFTGSRDKTVREWDLRTGCVTRVLSDIHTSSVLSICVKDGFVASAGSDRRVAVWDLERDELVKMLADHEDSVLCVRFDENRLVSCSKDRTVRTYTFPSLRPQFVLTAHRAAVNAVSLSPEFIVSGSGDRSIRLWDVHTGELLRTFDNHHSRGIASIAFNAPSFVVSGSSDKHLRYFDVSDSTGWGTAEDLRSIVAKRPPITSSTCSCHRSDHGVDDYGSSANAGIEFDASRSAHSDLVRSVAFNEDWVVSGSYDLAIKVWERETGRLVADLTEGHTGRIFCVGFDYTKIVSCGEDQKICVWDFSHGIDTSFIRL